MNEKEKTFSVDLFLIAEGLSNCRRSYRDDKAEKSYSEYMNCNIDKISEIWPYLSEDIKIDYIKKNMDSVFSFIREVKSLEVK